MRRPLLAVICVAPAIALAVGLAALRANQETPPRPAAIETSKPAGFGPATDTPVVKDQPVGTFDADGNPLFDARTALTEMLTTKGVEVAAQTIDAWSRANPMYARTCHNDAHMLGAQSARIAPPESVVQYATDQCDFGFIHGVLKATALDSPPDVSPSQLAELCYKAPETIASNCEHGLGHAIPLRDKLSLSESFEMCATLPTARSSAQCVTGASMEFGVNYMIFHDLRSTDPGSLNANGTLEQLEITEAERLDPCAALRGKTFDALDVCYRHVHYFWSPELGEDYRAFGARCATFADDKNLSCFQSLGAWAWYEEEATATTPVPVHKALLDRSCMTLANNAGTQACIHGYMHSIWQSEFRALPSLCAVLGDRYEPGCSTAESRFRKEP